MSKKYDVVARTGSYQDKNGEEKGKYKTVGMVYEKNGKFGLMIDTPVVLDDDGDVVKFFGLYEPRQNTEKKEEDRSQDFSDEIPFN